MRSLLHLLFIRIPRSFVHRTRRSWLKLFHRDYSESGETIAVREALRDYPVRYFVEVGANDGRFVSTTYGLMLDGWDGLCIEPHPIVYEKLRENVKDFTNVKTVCCAASPKRGKLQLFLGKDDRHGIYSTLSSEDSAWYRAHRDDAFVMVDGKPLTEILEDTDVPARFGLLLVDTEGMDLDVFRTLDFEKYRPQLIVTEDYAPKNDQKFALLESYEYRFVRRIGCNTFWLNGRRQVHIEGSF